MKIKNQLFAAVFVVTLTSGNLFAGSVEQIKTPEAAKSTFSLFTQLNRYVKTEKEYLARLEKAFKHGYELYVYKDDKGEQVGLMGLSYPEELYWDTYMHIDTLVVDEKHRRKGIATKLLDYAKGIADKMKVTKLSWETGAHSKEPQAFYAAKGFKEQAFEYRYYPKK